MSVDNTGERTIAVVLYPGLTALDLVGPLQVLTELERFASQYRTVVVGAHTEPMATDLPLQLVADRTFAEVPYPDVLVVPGGRIGTIRAMSDAGVRAYVHAAADSADVVGSVCTGSLILGAVGLLQGRQATTNWFFAGVLAPLGATYHRQRWVEDGRFLTAVGGAAGINAMLHMLARQKSRSSAQLVQLFMEYDPEPPFGPLGPDRGDPELAALLRNPRQRAHTDHPAGQREAP